MGLADERYDLLRGAIDSSPILRMIWTILIRLGRKSIEIALAILQLFLGRLTKILSNPAGLYKLSIAPLNIIARTIKKLSFPLLAYLNLRLPLSMIKYP